MVWCLLLILKSSQPLFNYLFHPSLIFLDCWYSQYTFVNNFEITPQFLDVLHIFLYVFFFHCRLGNVPAFTSVHAQRCFCSRVESTGTCHMSLTSLTVFSVFYFQHALCFFLELPFAAYITHVFFHQSLYQFGFFEDVCMAGFIRYVDDRQTDGFSSRTWSGGCGGQQVRALSTKEQALRLELRGVGWCRGPAAEFLLSQGNLSLAVKASELLGGGLPTLSRKMPFT